MESLTVTKAGSHVSQLTVQRGGVEIAGGGDFLQCAGFQSSFGEEV